MARDRASFLDLIRRVSQGSPAQMEQSKELLYSVLFRSDIGTLVPHVPVLLAEGGTGADLSATGPGLIWQSAGGAALSVFAGITPTDDGSSLVEFTCTRGEFDILGRVGTTGSAGGGLYIEAGSGYDDPASGDSGVDSGDVFIGAGDGGDSVAGTGGSGGTMEIYAGAAGSSGGGAGQDGGAVTIGSGGGGAGAAGGNGGAAGGITFSGGVGGAAVGGGSGGAGGAILFAAGAGGSPGGVGGSVRFTPGLTSGGSYAPVFLGSDTVTTFVGINRTSDPTARLHLPAGTATASTAPLKLTTGVALGTPEDGAVEYHTSHLYFTIGSTRYQLDQQIPTLITVADESADTTCFPLFVTAATGDLGPKSNAGLTYNSSTSALGSTILQAGSSGSVASMAAAGIVFNEGGADLDTRVEGDNNANLLYIDAGNDRVGIKTASPAAALEINNTNGKHLFYEGGSGTTAYQYIELDNRSSGAGLAAFLKLSKSGTGKWASGVDLLNAGTNAFHIYSYSVPAGIRAAFTDSGLSVSPLTSGVGGNLTISGTQAFTGGNAGVNLAATNLSTTGITRIRVTNDSGKFAMVAIGGSAYGGDAGLANNAIYSTDNSMFFMTDHNVANGGSGTLNFMTGGYTTSTQVRMAISAGGLLTAHYGAVINESGGDNDTRIEGDTATNLLVCDAGLDAVQIGTTVAGAILDCRAAEVVGNDGGSATVDLRWEGDTEDKLFVIDTSADAVYMGDFDTNYTKVAKTGLVTFAGTGGLSLPYALLSDSTTQTITGLTTAAYSVTFDTDEYKSGITHSTSTNPSRITIDTAGTYRILFSIIGEVGTANKHIDIWLAVDGSNVARSNTITEFTTAGNERLITVEYVYKFTAAQYFEIKWCSDVASATLKATGTQTNPTRPACPSVILSVNMISKD